MSSAIHRYRADFAAFSREHVSARVSVPLPQRVSAALCGSDAIRLFRQTPLHRAMSEPAAVQEAGIAQVEAISEPAAPVPDSAPQTDGMDQEQDDDSGDEGGADGDGNGQANGTGSSSSSSKKKKKKKSNKKKKASGAAANGAAGGVHAVMQQTEPPTIGLTKIYINGQFPIGQECEYVGE